MIFPPDWYVDVVVERGAGGLDRFGKTLPVEEIVVERCLLGPKNNSDPDRLGAWADSEATIFHEDFVFLKNDLITVQGPNPGVWEVVDDSSQWPYGTSTPIRKGGSHE